MKILIWLALCLIWGTTWFFIKDGLEVLPPVSFASIRFIIAVCILAVLLCLRKVSLPQTKSQWKIIALSGVLQFSINYSVIFLNEQNISTGFSGSAVILASNGLIVFRKRDQKAKLQKDFVRNENNRAHKYES